MSQTMEQNDSGSLRENEEPDKKQKSRRPPNTAFRQQRLKAWQPILTPKTVLPLFFIVGVIFAPIGGLLLYASAQVQELRIDYSHCTNDTSTPTCGDGGNFAPVPSAGITTYFKNTTDEADRPTWCKYTKDVKFGNATVSTDVCRVQFYLPDKIGPPVLLYYQLTNFYQNHRRYVKSFDQDQLKGTDRDLKAINGSDCDPLKTETVDGVVKAIYPCGLIANSVFNDTFNDPVALNWPGAGTSNVTYEMANKNIAWSTDKDLYGMTKYNLSDVVPPPNWRQRYPTYNESFPFPDLHTDEAFQVWMRTAGLPTFSKLALRNDTVGMEPGRYQMDVYDYFPVTEYQGTKSILISTRTVMGGRNPFLGIAYVVVGGICIVLGALFTATHLIKPRKLGDHNYLSWNTDQPTSATASGRAPRNGDTA